MKRINTKNKIIDLVQFLFVFGVFMLIGAQVAYAQVSNPLEVVFENHPLFNQQNFLPGDNTKGTVTVTNNSGITQRIITEAINGSDPDGLGSVLILRISEQDVSGFYYDDTLGNFLSSAGEVDLSPSVPDGETVKYLYEVRFDKNAEDYQNANLGFDICIGFFNEIGRVCGDTVVGDELDNEENGDEIISFSSEPSGSGSYIPPLIITNEQASSLTDGTVVVEWSTNFLSTSQVVYGLANSNYEFDLENTEYPYYFGYPSGTIEDKTKVTSHRILLVNLEVGKVYKFRVISRASPPTVSYERTFVVEGGQGEKLALLEGLTDGLSRDFSTQYPDSRQNLEQKDIAGNEELFNKEVSEENFSDTSGEEIFIDKEGRLDNLAASFFAFLKSGLGFWGVTLVSLLIIFMFFAWRLANKKLQNGGKF